VIAISLGFAAILTLVSLPPETAVDRTRVHHAASGSMSECEHCKRLPLAFRNGFDDETGRDTRSFPPHRHADFTHLSLELTIDDMNTPEMSGSATLSFTPLGTPLSELVLDARCMTIRGVSSAGTGIAFEYDGSHLLARFPEPIAVGTASKITIDYDVVNPPAGLMWTPESAAWLGRPAQLHTQGEPETNSYWFPCHDSPNDRLTTEVAVTVPAGFEASSNGALVSRTAVGTGTRFHYSQEKDHVAYLVSLIVGKFDIVELTGGPVPMKVWAPVGRGEDVAGTFGNTPAMAHLFGEITGEPYPWAKYDQLIVWNFGWGGMENTSVTTLFDTAIIAETSRDDFDLDGLISHELAHQWFGDLITCNSWEHIWLNEGFATYFTHLWFERHAGRTAYLAGVRGNFDGIIAADTGSIPEASGMVSKNFSHPWETFRRPANPYGKGASILHMLRTKLGDERFFAGVREYVKRRRFTTSETSDLRRAFEDVSGESLEQFFHQWCERPGVPSIAIMSRYDADSRALIIDAAQTQFIDGDNPAFEFDLPVLIYATGTGEPIASSLNFFGRTASLAIPLDAEPYAIAYDPELAVLAQLTIQESSVWSRQLLTNTAASFNSRIHAARTLASQADADSIRDLASITASDTNPKELRLECIKALGEGIEKPVIARLWGSDAWELRAAAYEAVGKGTLDLVPLLQKAATNERSERAKAAALRALGARGSGDLPLIESALMTDSQDDILRQAALDALLESQSPTALEVAIRLTRPGTVSRTRAAATAAIGRVFEQDPDLALETLELLLSDPEPRVGLSAGDALVATKLPRALDILAAASANTCGRDAAWRFENWIRALNAQVLP